ncbi:hypothetical protein PV327_000054 [Microctonus hyperodae]|uniref:H15 domain-containing protein n=1 Tax=Microctonus hyperodae TaxID=165561 RepID=A0AA39G5F6_MICHY|nr:hypothetical protein PV327_000054 [Microctonus hyperodae]
MAKVNQRGVKKISRPARNVNLVVCAMRNLSDEHGSTVGNIVGYLADCCERPAPKREVVAALKRGIEFGIVDRRRGRYFLGENEKRLGRISRIPDGNSTTTPTRSRGSRRASGVTTRDGTDDNTTSTGILERDARSRKLGKTKKDRKSKNGTRRKKNNKKSGRKSMKKTRFARSLNSYNLSEHYHNPSYKASAVSSVDSIENYPEEA